MRSGSSWVLVDTGWAKDASRIERAAWSLFGAGSRPAGILLTHVHPDHAGSALELARSWGCLVYLHPEELPVARGEFAAMVASAGPLDRWVVLPLLRAMGTRRREAVLGRSSLGAVARVRTGIRCPRAARLGVHPDPGPHSRPRVVLPAR